MSDTPKMNTDRELWREREGDYYADSIHVTQGGGIGINCGGHVIVMPIREWHALARPPLSLPSDTQKMSAEREAEIRQHIEDSQNLCVCCIRASELLAELDRLRAKRPVPNHENENELLFDPNEVREAAQPTAEEESELREVIKLVRRAYAANEQSALKDFHTLDFYDKLESYLDSVAQAVAAARLAEREACAKVAENGRFLYDDAPDAKFGRACATAIRRRAELEKGR